MAGKRPGKKCRMRRFVPPARRRAIQKAQAIEAFSRWHAIRIVVASHTSHWGAVMTRAWKAAVLAALIALIAPVSAGATSRIKDLANIEGVRQNQLIGYGLVVGLNGTGDTLNNIPFTKQSLQAMLERMGVRTS